MDTGQADMGNRQGNRQERPGKVTGEATGEAWQSDRGSNRCGDRATGVTCAKQVNMFQKFRGRKLPSCTLRGCTSAAYKRHCGQILIEVYRLLEKHMRIYPYLLMHVDPHHRAAPILNFCRHIHWGNCRKQRQGTIFTSKHIIKNAFAQCSFVH